MSSIGTTLLNSLEQDLAGGGRLREASLDHLRRRIALPLQAPRDWTRTNPLKCTCGDCSLGTVEVRHHRVDRGRSCDPSRRSQALPCRRLQRNACPQLVGPAC
jgi:hypothetical protein